jgi:hypothetical protein
MGLEPPVPRDRAWRCRLRVMGLPVREWVDRMRAVHERVDRDELRRARAMTQDERVAALQSACRLATQTLASMAPDVRARALAWRDPLPDSTVRALSRLRAEARQKAQRHG